VNSGETCGSGAGRWTHGTLPPNARVGERSLITGDDLTAPRAFDRFRSRREGGLTIGRDCLLDGVSLSVGAEGRVLIGDACWFQESVLVCELDIRIGDRVVIGWQATVADADFHPTDPAARVRDTIALSPVSRGLPREPFARRPVVIGDDVWIGPNAAVLKGVTIGPGAFVEPGAVVTRDVPAGARVIGNPARPIEEIGG